MTITLTDELEELVNEKVRSGAYKSADELIAESLRLLEAKEKGIDALRHEILLGIEDIKQGRFTTCATDAELDIFSDEIIKQGRENLDASEKQ